MMHKRTPPNGFSWMSPYITVGNVDKAVEFYEKAFNFTLRSKAPGDDGSTAHAELSYQGQTLMLGKQGAWGAKALTPAHSGVESPINLYLYCDDVDALCQQAKHAGAKVEMEPTDAFWGDRMCRLIDLDGLSWSFATSNQSA